MAIRWDEGIAMKHSVFTVMMPEFNIEDTAKILRDLGFDGVEWRVGNIAMSPEKPSYWGYNRSTVDLATIEEKASAVKILAERHGLEISCLATYLGVGQIEEIKRALRAARAMNCPFVRVGAPRYDGTKNYNQLFEETVRDAREVERQARDMGVTALLELHMGNIMPSAGLAHRIVSNFDHRHIGVIYDPGNMIYEGYEQWKMGLELLGKYLRHVHVKNSAWLRDREGRWRAEAAQLEDGIVDWRKLLGDLRSAGYDGYLSLEDFTEQETISKLKRDLRYLKTL
jgi:sugar phosphate isomerase/epimerase